MLVGRALAELRAVDLLLRDVGRRALPARFEAFRLALATAISSNEDVVVCDDLDLRVATPDGLREEVFLKAEEPDDLRDDGM